MTDVVHHHLFHLLDLPADVSNRVGRRVVVKELLVNITDMQPSTIRFSITLENSSFIFISTAVLIVAPYISSKRALMSFKYAKGIRRFESLSAIHIYITSLSTM